MKARGIPRGGARPSLFKVRFAAIPPGVPNAADDIEYVGRATESPASVIRPIDVPYWGRTIKVAGQREFLDWTVTFINDETMKHRNMFEAWHNKINTLESNRQNSDESSMLDYKVPAEVLQFGKAGPGDDSGVIRAYQFEGLFPSNVGPMRLDWQNGNQIQEFDVTFAYDYWIPVIFDPGSEPYSPTLDPDPQGTVTQG
jgi:hypothetical protein